MKANSYLWGLTHLSSRPAANEDHPPLQLLESNHFLAARVQIKKHTEMDQLCQSQSPGIENVPITGDNENRNMMTKLSFHQTT